MSTRLFSHCCAIALLACGQAARADEPDQPAISQPIQVEAVLQFSRAVAGESGRFWIGVSCEPGEKGLVVEQVTPDSPAAQAGLQKGDVIVAVNKTPIKQFEQLANAVADSQGKPLVLQVARDDEALAITVKPNKQAAFAFVETDNEEGNDDKQKPDAPKFKAQRIRIVEGGQPGSSGNPATRYQPVPGQPGAARMVMRGPMAGGQSQLPDDMEVKVSKKGNRPAVVKVKQGKKSWQTTEDDLGMLPPPAQAYVARLLGQGPQPGMPGMMMPGMGSPPGSGGGGGPPQFNLRRGGGGQPEMNQPQPLQPQIRQIPGGGLQIEIREPEQRKKKEPQQKKEPKQKNSPAEQAQAEKDEAIGRLRKQEQALRQALEELRSKAGPEEEEKKE